jgi:hypothetical protein
MVSRRPDDEDMLVVSMVGSAVVLIVSTAWMVATTADSEHGLDGRDDSAELDGLEGREPSAAGLGWQARSLGDHGEQRNQSLCASRDLTGWQGSTIARDALAHNSTRGVARSR